MRDRQPHRLTNGLAALASGLSSDAAGVNDFQVCALWVVHLAQAPGAEQRSDLLALILIDLAA